MARRVSAGLVVVVLIAAVLALMLQSDEPEPDQQAKPVTTTEPLPSVPGDTAVAPPPPGLVTVPPPAPTTTEVAPGCEGVDVEPGNDIAAVLEAHPPGTTFCLEAGVHRMARPAIPETGDTLLGERGTVLSGARVLTGFRRDGARWVATGQRQQAPRYDDPCPDTSASAGYPEGVYLDDVALTQVVDPARLAPGRFWFDYERDRIVLADDPRGRLVEASIGPAAIVGYAGRGGAASVTIRDVTVEKFTTPGTDGMIAAIKAGEGWRIERIEARLNHASGIDLNTGTLLRDSRLHHNGQYGFTGGGEAILVEGNEISHNNTGGFDGGCDAGGSKIRRSRGLVVRGNVVHHNDGPGLWTDGDNIDVRYLDNRIVANRRGGILHEIGYAAVIRGNHVRGNQPLLAGRSLWHGAEITLNDSQDVTVVDNTIVADVHGISLIDIDRGRGAYGVRRVANVIVERNTIVLPRGGQVGLVADRDAAFDAGTHFVRNHYRVRDPEGEHWVWGSARGWAGWQGVGHDRSGTLEPA